MAVNESNKTLRAACAEAEGWKRRTESPGVGLWFRDDPRRLYESPPAYGFANDEGHALMAEMMRAHKINVVVFGSDPEEWLATPAAKDSLPGYGAHPAEAVARCRVAMAEEERASGAADESCSDGPRAGVDLTLVEGAVRPPEGY